MPPAPRSALRGSGRAARPPWLGSPVPEPAPPTPLPGPPAPPRTRPSSRHSYRPSPSAARGRFAEGVFGFASGAGREPRGPNERLRTLRERRQCGVRTSVSRGRRLGPVGAPADVGTKGHVEIDRVFHPVGNQGGRLFHPVLRDLED